MRLTIQEVAALQRSQERLFKARDSAVNGDLRFINKFERGLETQMALSDEELSFFQCLRSNGFVARCYQLDMEKQLAAVEIPNVIRL